MNIGVVNKKNENNIVANKLDRLGAIAFRIKI